MIQGGSPAGRHARGGFAGWVIGSDHESGSGVSAPSGPEALNQDAPADAGRDTR